MAMTKEELMKAKLAKQNQQNKSAFEMGSAPIVPTRDVPAEEPAAAPIPKARERKAKRIQILTYESLVDRMDAFAERMGLSRAELFENAVSAYLDQFDK